MRTRCVPLARQLTRSALISACVFAANPVIALDVSPVRLALARHNAALYGVADRIEFVLGDFLSFARTLETRRAIGSSEVRKREIDVVFLSPPWGGPSYLTAPSSPTKAQAAPATDPDAPETDETYAEFGLASIRPVHGTELFKIARGITQNVAYFLPRNTSLDEISHLLDSEGTQPPSGEPSKQAKRKDTAKMEMVEIEEEWMGSKLKALTCYFGGLVAGQEDLFES